MILAFNLNLVGIIQFCGIVLYLVYFWSNKSFYSPGIDQYEMSILANLVSILLWSPVQKKNGSYKAPNR